MGVEERSRKTLRGNSRKKRMKRLGLPLVALLAVLPLAGCTADQTWDAHTSDSTPTHLIDCQVAIGHQVKPVNSGISAISYGTTVKCTEAGGNLAEVHITGYSQIATFPLIGFGSGKYGQATAAGTVDALRNQSYTFHGSFTLTFAYPGISGLWWAPVDGCTRSGGTGPPNYQAPILTCTFDHTIRT